MNDDEEMKGLCRYYWIAGYWCGYWLGSAVTASVMTVVGLVIWII